MGIIPLSSLEQFFRRGALPIAPVDAHAIFPSTMPMRQILPLKNRIQSYDWGSRTAIPELLGQSPTGSPQAELWMGDHPKAPSDAWVDGRWRSLESLVREHPQALLGAADDGGGDPRLPFLLKVLAAERALSIQAHPDRPQAVAGFDREEAAGIHRWAADRNYRDRNHKPEILYALGPFWMMRGFRPVDDIRALTTRLGISEDSPFDVERPSDLRRLLDGLLRLDVDTAGDLVDRVLGRLPSESEAGGDPLAGPAFQWMERLGRQYPRDRGVLAPLFLQVLRLEAGQAMFTGAGVLHAYLDGTGIELMASSDNVVRGALTGKHVDPDELMSILRFEPAAPEPLRPRQPSQGVTRFETPADFALSVLTVEKGSPTVGRATTEGEGGSVEVLLCVDGAGEILVDDTSGDAAAPVPYRRGDSFLVPAAVPGYRFEGSGRFFRAESRPPRA
ncbi:MAG: mannose-6-phosphate isomerase, class I [Acidobacteriota bacterium]